MPSSGPEGSEARKFRPGNGLWWAGRGRGAAAPARKRPLAGRKETGCSGSGPEMASGGPEGGGTQRFRPGNGLWRAGRGQSAAVPARKRPLAGRKGAGRGGSGPETAPGWPEGGGARRLRPGNGPWRAGAFAGTRGVNDTGRPRPAVRAQGPEEGGDTRSGRGGPGRQKRKSRAPDSMAARRWRVMSRTRPAGMSERLAAMSRSPSVRVAGEA